MDIPSVYETVDKLWRGVDSTADITPLEVVAYNAIMPSLRRMPSLRIMPYAGITRESVQVFIVQQAICDMQICNMQICNMKICICHLGRICKSATHMDTK